MNFDFWYRLMGPGGMLFFACAILAVGAFAGWFARGSDRRRVRKSDSAMAATTVGTAGEEAPPAPIPDAELPRRKRDMPREWDGGQPRPNWNRRSG